MVFVISYGLIVVIKDNVHIAQLLTRGVPVDHKAERETMTHSMHRRSVRAAAGFAAMTLPLGLVLPAMAAETAASSPAIIHSEEEISVSEPREAEPSEDPTETLPSSGAGEEAGSSVVNPELDAAATPELETADVTPELNANSTGDQDLSPNPQVEVLEESLAKAAASVKVNNHRFFLNDRWTGAANTEFTWGEASYQVFVGDWDGDGKDTVALRNGNQFAFSNTNPASGAPEFTFAFGKATDTIVVGDWDGDGKDTFAIRRGNTFLVKNSLSGSAHDTSFSFGRADDEIFVGDWDGNGTDTLAVRRGNEIHISNKNVSGKTDKVINFGRVGDDLYVGSFDRSRPGQDSFAVRRGNTYFINKAMKSGNADIQLNYGRINDVTLLGDWNGDGEDTLGVVRTVTTTESTQPPAEEKSLGAEALAMARTFEGKVPYVRGGKLPDGWDCIGIIRYVYKHFGATVGPKPISVLDAGRHVPYSEAKPGDLLYWTAPQTIWGKADHVGIYIDAETNFGAGNTNGTSVEKTRWKGEPPIAVRVFE